MPRGESRDERFIKLVESVAALSEPEERRALLQNVCPDEPALAAELLETVTLQESADPAESPAHGLRPGQIVAERFQIVRPLGEGGMALVYEALDQKLGERRALKFSKSGHSQTIPPETRTALRVTHDNICRIHEIHTATTGAGPADFISMEYLDGETLLSRWRREPISTTDAAEIARQLCRGLDAAHRAHILHRDLKSNNVMLTKHADGSPRVVITDFGLARALAGGGKPTSSSISGTPSYIAPERWKGADATPASDVYALGVILYEMLAGELPFSKETPWKKRLNELPTPPSRSKRAPDLRWDAIVLRCLEPDPAKRFASASDVLADIDRAFHVSHRKQWLTAAAVPILTIGPVVAWREKIWPPPPLARLAVLPFTGSAPDQTAEEAVKGGLYDIGDRLAALGAMSRRVVVIPVEDSLRNDVDSPAKAATRLGATHVLSGAIGSRGQGFSVRAAVINTSTGQAEREFSGEFQRTDLAGLSTSLAGVVTSAFHLDKAPPARIQPAAYTTYAAGLANFHSPSSKVDESIALFEKALAQDTGSPLIHAGLAEAYLRKFTGTKDSALLTRASQHAKRAESLQPDSPPVLVVLGSIEQAEGRPERALDLFRRAAELGPNNWRAWQRIGLTLQRTGRAREAITALQKATQLAPDYYAPHLGLGFLYFQLGRHSEAAAEFRSVTQLAPELPDGYANLGGALLAIEQEADAEVALRRALTIRETRTALNNLSVLMRFQSRDKEAAEVLEKALGAGPDDTVIRLNLATTLRRLGRLSESREHFRKANALARAELLLDPGSGAARAHLAYSMVSLAMPGAADEALQATKLGGSDYSALFWSVMTLESLARRDDALAVLANVSYERLKGLSRQPDLADFTKDSRFTALLKASKNQN